MNCTPILVIKKLLLGVGSCRSLWKALHGLCLRFQRVLYWKHALAKSARKNHSMGDERSLESISPTYPYREVDTVQEGNLYSRSLSYSFEARLSTFKKKESVLFSAIAHEPT